MADKFKRFHMKRHSFEAILKSNFILSWWIFEGIKELERLWPNSWILRWSSTIHKVKHQLYFRNCSKNRKYIVCSSTSFILLKPFCRVMLYTYTTNYYNMTKWSVGSHCVTDSIIKKCWRFKLPLLWLICCVLVRSKCGARY